VSITWQAYASLPDRAEVFAAGDAVLHGPGCLGLPVDGPTGAVFEDDVPLAW
jgi:hypothetical protein